MSATIVSIAVKREKRGALDVVESAEINDEGVVGNIAQSEHRRVTLMSREHWEEVQSELNMDLPWTTRRANILVTGMDMGGAMVKTLTIGDVELLVEGETVPCRLMDEYFDGLNHALVPDYRGGVYARVIKGGNIANGDTILVSG